MSTIAKRDFAQTIWDAQTEDINGKRVLKESFVQCILAKLGAGAEHSVNPTDTFPIDVFFVPSDAMDLEEGEVPQKEKAIVSNFGTGPFVMSPTAALSNRVVQAIEDCNTMPAPTAGGKKKRKTKKSRKTKKTTRRR